jgi:hypothetical protein
MAVTLSSLAGAATQFFDNNGVPLAGGLIYTYTAGTTTPATTYTSSTGLIAHANPIVLDAAGRIATGEVWLTSGVDYKFLVKTSANVQLGSYDNIPSINDFTSIYAALANTSNVALGDALIGFKQSNASGALSNAIGRTVHQKLQESVSVKDFGAVGDGVTDDSVAIQAALDSGAISVYVPAAQYYLSQGITIPPSVILWSEGFAPSNPLAGTIFKFALATAICVTLGGASSNNNSSSIKGISITRNAGSIPVGSIGLLNLNTYASIIEDVACFRHAIGFDFEGDDATLGITCMVNRIFTGAISDSHVVIGTFPEVRFNQCRFGSNGAVDVACDSFVKIQGGSTTNPSTGPNTICMTNCQFNQGNGQVVTNWLNFANQTAGAISDIVYWSFDNCYIEGATNMVTSDSTWAALTRLLISNCQLNSPSGEFWNLDAATQINESVIASNLIFVPFTLAPTLQVNYLTVTGNHFHFAVSVTGVLGSVVNFGNNCYKTNLTIAGAFSNGAGNFKGGDVVGTFSYTGTGASIDIAPINTSVSWTPIVKFGGASTGITYSVQSGRYSIVNNIITVNFSITLTSKGSATGNASITNIPYAVNTNYGITGGAVPIFNNATGLTATPVFNISSVGSQIFISQYGSTGGVVLTDANFTNTTQINGSVSYYIA